MNSWKVGAQYEKRIKKLIESGAFDGDTYVCYRFPKMKFHKQDIFGADIICANDKNWLLCQVKYNSRRKPPMRKDVIKELLKDVKPDNTKHVIARIDGRDQQIYWDEV